VEYRTALINQQEHAASRAIDLLHKDDNFEAGDKSQVSF